MTTVDDRIRTALDAVVPETEPIEPDSLADRLRTRASARRRARHRARVAGIGGAMVLVLLVGATVALGDRSIVQVVADGTTGAAPDGTSAHRPLATALASNGFMMAPTLDNSLSAGHDLVFVAEVTAVGDPRPVATRVPSWDPDIPFPSYDISPVDVRVVERLRVAPGVDLADRIRLRMIEMAEIGTQIVGSGTTPATVGRPVSELLPVGSLILVFATRPVDVGDGLAATASTVFPISDGGAIDMDGRVVPLDEIRARSSGSPGPVSRTPIGTAPPPGPGTRPERADGDLVRVSFRAWHCDPLDAGAVMIRVWEPWAAGTDPDNPVPVQPAWRILSESLRAVDVAPETITYHEDSPARARSLITVEVPPRAASWLTANTESGRPLVASADRDGDVSCVGDPADLPAG